MNQPTATRLALALAATLALAAAPGAYANNFSKSAYDGAKNDIKSTYKAERDTCNSLSGNAKDICVEQVKGHEKIAMAQLDYNYTGATKDEVKVYQARYEARYDVAKEKCDDLAGDPKDLCLREAKTARDKAQADLKLAKKVSDAVDDADSTRMKADYKLAAEKCAPLAGDVKDVCMASAKARYNERW